MTIQFFGSQTWVPPLLRGTQDVLINGVPNMTSDRVFNSIWTDQQHIDFPPADQFITLFAPRFPVDQKNVTGGGTYDTAFDGRLIIKLFLRVESDIEGRSAQYLNDEVNGIYTFVNQVISLLQMWNGPDDGTGTETSQLRRPLRIVGEWEVHGKDAKDGRRWGQVTTNWEMSFVANLGTPNPVGM